MTVQCGVLVANLDSNNRSLEEAIAELERETNLRVRMYPGWIKDRKMSSLEAVERLERMAKAGAILCELLGAASSVPQEQSKCDANGGV